MLQKFGLSESAEQAYHAFVRGAVTTDSGLVGGLGVTKEDASKAVDELRARGLLRLSASTDSLQVTPPDEAIELLITSEEQELERRRLEIHSARSDVNALVESFVSAATETLADDAAIAYLRGSDAIRSKLYQLVDETSSVTLNMIPADREFSASAIESAERLDDRLISRGVHERFIVSESSMQNPQWRDYLQRIIAKGCQVRTHVSPPTLLVIFDHKTAIVPRGLDHLVGEAIIIHEPGIVEQIEYLFEEVWAASQPLTGLRAESFLSENLDPRLHQVVILLARGYKDEVIARKIGTSVRTVGRLVSEIIDLFGAQGRFQAGVIAAQQGWITEDLTSG